MQEKHYIHWNKEKKTGMVEAIYVAVVHYSLRQISSDSIASTVARKFIRN